MVFIVGLPRTGTSLMARMLGAHSKVDNMGELRAVPFFLHQVAGIPVFERVTPDLKASLSGGKLEEFGNLYKKQLPARAENHRYIIDKNPTNFWFAGEILAAMPEAKIIFMGRGAADTCLSNYKQLFAAGAHGYSYDMATITEVIECYREIACQVITAFPDRAMEVSYEDLVKDASDVFSKVLSFLDLDWQDACLAPQSVSGGVNTASFAQANRPIYETSVGRWKEYALYLPALKQVARQFNEV